MGRDPGRIPTLLAAIGECWVMHPDMRLPQLLSSLSGARDPFYVDDDELLRLAREWLARGGPPGEEAGGPAG